MNGFLPWAALLLMALLTFLLRGLPFFIFQHQTMPPVLVHLGNVLPYAVMGMLVVYCLKDMTFSSAGGFLPYLMATFLTVLTYIWKRNTLLSIVSGTLCYMVLVQLVF